MRKIFEICVFAGTFIVSLLLSSNLTYAKPSLDNYTLVFSDDFTGTSLNRNKWSTYHVVWNIRSIPQIGHQQLYIEKGYNGLKVTPHILHKGVLSLVADRSPNLAKTANYPYYSAMISTEKSYNGLYGYYETRLRMPKGLGLWPAIWMVPSDGRDHLPEIDVLEVLGHQPSVIYQYAHPDGGDDKTQYLYGGSIQVDMVDTSNDFHTYGLEWTPEYIAWFVDGQETQRVKNFAFEPHYYIINLAVGGYWPGYPDKSTAFPASVDIDYVRIYSK